MEQSKDRDRMVRIRDQELFTEAKVFAATRGLTLIEITEKALKQYFSKNRKKVVDISSNV